jgi:hypothetical protein
LVELGTLLGPRRWCLLGGDKALSDLDDKAQMAGNELVRRIAVAVLEPVLGQPVFFMQAGFSSGLPN